MQVYQKIMNIYEKSQFSHIVQHIEINISLSDPTTWCWIKHQFPFSRWPEVPKDHQEEPINVIFP